MHTSTFTVFETYATWTAVAQVCDIAQLTELAHAVGALVCVDNSIMAPLFQRPLELGADISMTSATKFIGGHSDMTGGILTVKARPHMQCWRLLKLYLKAGNSCSRAGSDCPNGRWAT